MQHLSFVYSQFIQIQEALFTFHIIYFSRMLLSALVILMGFP